jgi:hypothetical protein
MVDAKVLSLKERVELLLESEVSDGAAMGVYLAQHMGVTLNPALSQRMARLYAAGESPAGKVAVRIIDAMDANTGVLPGG